MKPAYFPVLLIFALFSACNPISPTQAASLPSPTSPAETTILTWQRTGGFAGFCDEVTIYSSGKADVYTCKGIEATILLTETQREQLDGWFKSLASIEYLSSDPAVTDAMTISFSFTGYGTQEADKATIGLISKFAADLQAQANFELQAPPEKEEAEQALRDYLAALNSGDYILAAKLYGGETELLETWNPDITNDLPALFERACTQNGLNCLPPRTITYRGPDAGGFQFLVEFSNPDGTLFRQGPCCGDESGATATSFLFRVIKASSGFVVMDLPPYTP